MQSVVNVRMGRTVYAQFEPDEDVYRGLVKLIEKEQLKTSIILSVTGASTRCV